MTVRLSLFDFGANSTRAYALASLLAETWTSSTTYSGRSQLSCKLAKLLLLVPLHFCKSRLILQNLNSALYCGKLLFRKHEVLKKTYSRLQVPYPPFQRCVYWISTLHLLVPVLTIRFTFRMLVSKRKFWWLAPEKKSIPVRSVCRCWHHSPATAQRRSRGSNWSSWPP